MAACKRPLGVTFKQTGKVSFSNTKVNDVKRPTRFHPDVLYIGAFSDASYVSPLLTRCPLASVLGCFGCSCTGLSHVTAPFADV